MAMCSWRCPIPGEVMLLRDSNGEGRADVATVFARGFHRPHGLAVQDGYLYVADVERVWRLAWHAGDSRAAGRAEPVTAYGVFGSAKGHWTRNIVFAPDGKRFFVDVGSADNIGEDPSPRATVQSFAADGGDQRTFASGLRNAVGIAFYPGNRRPLRGGERARRDGRRAWCPIISPGCRKAASTAGPTLISASMLSPICRKRPDMVARSIVPDLLFQSHSAPLGLVFYEGAMFPAEYQGDAFVSLHGSWNAEQPTGYKIVRVPFKNGRPVGYYENFLTGFWVGRRISGQCLGQARGPRCRQGRKPAGGRRRERHHLARSATGSLERRRCYAACSDRSRIVAAGPQSRQAGSRWKRMVRNSEASPS